ncbi:hypothetical protein [Metapseudomonas resinovorans]|nr:hypothetical protein [Pseudomonas resinovorans]
MSPSLIGYGVGAPTNAGFNAQIAAAASSTLITNATTQDPWWTASANTL